jgi:tRNA pseudouridine38-40 synthase
MHYYKATFQYAGTNYCGFQWQKDIPTVQSEINRALKILVHGQVSTMGASRTDSGVHALEQVVKITTENIIEISSFKNKLNATLAQDIICIDFNTCSPMFSPSVETISKEYRYLFTNKTQVPFESQKYIANLANQLNLELMQKCVNKLIGTHDFCNFYSMGSNVKTTVRTISFCELTRINPHQIFESSTLIQLPKELTECFQLTIVADGFLKQMIRHIVSALWMVGSEKLSIEKFDELLLGPQLTKRMWKPAPANGLFLYKIKYS